MTGDPASQSIAGDARDGCARSFDARRALAAMVKGATRTGVSPNAGYVERPALDEYLRLGYVPHERNSNFSDLHRQSVHPRERAESRCLRRPTWRGDPRARPWSTPRRTSRSRGSRQGWAPGGPAARSSVARPTGATSSTPRSDTCVRGWRRGAFVDAVRPQPQRRRKQSRLRRGKRLPVHVDGAPRPRRPLPGAGRQAPRLASAWTRSSPSSTRARARPTRSSETSPTRTRPGCSTGSGGRGGHRRSVRQAILGLFDASPGGFPGNDDLGQMSAWYVLRRDRALSGDPRQRRARHRKPAVSSGRPFAYREVMRARREGARRGAPYVHGLTVNGRRWTKPWTRVRDIARGATLRFALRARPDKAGARPSPRPRRPMDPAAGPPAELTDCGWAAVLRDRFRPVAAVLVLERPDRVEDLLVVARAAEQSARAELGSGRRSRRSPPLRKACSSRWGRAASGTCPRRTAP